jgi:hypothetical protein
LQTNNAEGGEDATAAPFGGWSDALASCFFSFVFFVLSF